MFFLVFSNGGREGEIGLDWIGLEVKLVKGLGRQFKMDLGNVEVGTGSKGSMQGNSWNSSEARKGHREKERGRFERSREGEVMERWCGRTGKKMGICRQKRKEPCKDLPKLGS